MEKVDGTITVIDMFLFCFFYKIMIAVTSNCYTIISVMTNNCYLIILAVTSICYTV